MNTYVIQRLLLILPTMFGVTVVLFMAVRFLPGDAVDQMLGDFGAASPELRRQLEERYSLNNSIPQQYVDWMGELVTGDLGTSITSGRSVSSELQRRLPATFQLGLLAMAFSLMISLPIGIVSAVKQNTPIDYAARSLAIMLLSVPSFWLGLLAITYGFAWFGWTPPLRYEQIWEDPIANLQILWVPALILGGLLSGTTMRIMRSTMLEVLREDYIRTARAKGLGARLVVMRHGLRNAILPVITVIGLQVPVVVGGTVLLERIFSIPGMGSYLLTSLSQRDYPVVQAIVLISASFIILTNLLVDLSYSVIDPRIRYR
ncbi:MAG: ABC transporter permease [Dehalococcoidia bacterium]|nr:ABC transporter permease [Dehalococcoidia bacterium]